MTHNKDWEGGNLTIDDIKNIIEVCHVNNVVVRSEILNISFVPKSVTGKAWKELKEKMQCYQHQGELHLLELLNRIYFVIYLISLSFVEINYHLGAETCAEISSNYQLYQFIQV